MVNPAAEEFETFFRNAEPRLRPALFAALGAERGREATAEAFAWAWETWPRVRQLENPIGYLFRVGQSKTRRKRSLPLSVAPAHEEPQVEPGLAGALKQLSDAQRVAVVLVHGFGWTLREVAELQSVRVTSIQTHVERGLRRLRAALEVTDNA
jgi:DNA-directed RNA polymerase specialized sigma24 family protein